jgi:DNA polymerase III subunit beta
VTTDNEQLTGFTAKRFHLLDLTEHAVKAVPGKNIYPLLANFQVVFGDGRIRVTATDMELSVISESELVVCRGSGTVLLPAKKFKEILSQADEGDVDVRIAGSTASITASSASWSLVLQPADDYPPLPDVAAISWTDVSRHKFLMALTLVRKAASRDGTNPRLMAVSVSGGKVVAASHVRLHRVILRDVVLPDIQIPVGAVDNLVMLLSKSRLDEIGIGQEEHVLAFKVGSDVFMAGKLASAYPDMEQRLLSGPLASSREELQLNKGDLEAAIKRVRITADQETAAIGLELAPGRLRVISRDKNGNTAREEIPAQWPHKQRLVTVNHEYLADLLGLAEGPQVLFKLGADAGKRRSPLLLLDEKAGTAGIIGQLLPFLIE